MTTTTRDALSDYSTAVRHLAAYRNHDKSSLLAAMAALGLSQSDLEADIGATRLRLAALNIAANARRVQVDLELARFEQVELENERASFNISIDARLADGRKRIKQLQRDLDAATNISIPEGGRVQSDDDELATMTRDAYESAIREKHADAVAEIHLIDARKHRYGTLRSDSYRKAVETERQRDEAQREKLRRKIKHIEKLSKGF